MNEREDKWNGEIGVVFAGVSSEEGRITAIEPSQRKIIFIGDSITEGIMSLSDNAISDYNSATHSYSWYTAKLLDAEPYFVGFGATGIVATGSFNTCENMLDYYSASRKIPETDFPDCDLAVINTGTNDIGVESDVFIEGYQTVLQKLHSRYPEIAIVCMIPFNQSHAEDIRKAAEAYQWSYVIETADWTLTYSDGIHPDSKGAQKAAEYLAAYIDEQGLNRLWK
jgi:lysophospholipase L1-like esterase